MTDVETTNPIANAMLRHWRGGKRGIEFHDAVSAEIPDCTLDQYKEAADLASTVLEREGAARSGDGNIKTAITGALADAVTEHLGQVEANRRALDPSGPEQLLRQRLYRFFYDFLLTYKVGKDTVEEAVRHLLEAKLKSPREWPEDAARLGAVLREVVRDSSEPQLQPLLPDERIRVAHGCRLLWPLQELPLPDAIALYEELAQRGHFERVDRELEDDEMPF